jgi:hypothetical protein
MPVWDADRPVGVRVRLIEVDGRGAEIQLRGFRSFLSARKVDAMGQTIQPCDVEDDRVRLSISPHEQVELEAKFG